MSKREELEVSIKDVIDRFDVHIKPTTNTSILFSGKYGTGKSTFLREYFAKKKKNYYPVFLSPVNYVVSSNENIFELIKVDIIKQLYADGHLNFDKVEISKYTTGITYALQKPFDLVRHIANAASKLHPILEVASSGSKAIHELLKDVSKFQGKMNEDLQSNKEKLVEFAGEYLEFDTISKLLKEAINQAKGKKKSVLIIDDLDRLDPEHIFRILNILSAHHETNQKHKLGFDKVVIVADVENLEKLFNHRYGQVDFDGYLDKFYSHEIFDFSNKEALIVFVTKNFELELAEDALSILILLLDIFVSSGFLKIRNIIKYKTYKKPTPFIVERKTVDQNLSFKLINIPVVKLNEENHLWIDSDDIPLVYVIGLLSTIFGRYKKLKGSLTHIQSNSSQTPIISDIHSKMLKTVLLPSFISNYQNQDLFPFLNYEQSGRNYCIPMRYENRTFWLNHNWNLNNPYTGKCSFYSNMNLNADPQQDRNIHFRISDLARIMLQVMNYLEENKLLSKMDINE